MQHKQTIIIEAKNELEALKKLSALQEIAKNISSDNLATLAEKSKKAGINTKIQLFQSYI